MFLGMSFCLPLAYASERRAARAAGVAGAAAEPLLGAPPRAPAGAAGGARDVALLLIPTAFDLAATALMNVGLLSVTASVYQMLRGAEMLFAALFAVAFLRRRLNSAHGAGIAACCAGIALVGAASLLSGEGSASHAVEPRKIAAGMALIVASQAVQAAQITFEDFFMVRARVVGADCRALWARIADARRRTFFLFYFFFALSARLNRAAPVSPTPPPPPPPRPPRRRRTSRCRR
jgi:drug/metabolite transporter (DMT)-like permease